MRKSYLEEEIVEKFGEGMLNSKGNSSAGRSMFSPWLPDNAKVFPSHHKMCAA